MARRNCPEGTAGKRSRSSNSPTAQRPERQLQHWPCSRETPARSIFGSFGLPRIYDAGRPVSFAVFREGTDWVSDGGP